MGKKVKLLDEKRTDLLKIDVRAIEANYDENWREDYGNLEELAKDIKQNGVKVPLKGYRDKDDPNKFILTHGFRRVKACMMLLNRGEITEIRVPFMLNPKGFSEVDTIMEHFSLNNMGKPLTMLEMAAMVQRLHVLNLTEKEIADKFSKSITFVKNCLALLEAPEWVKNLIRNDQISSTLVLDIFRKEKNFDEAVKLLSKLEVKLETAQVKDDKKITAKDVAEVKGKINSVRIFKKMFTKTHKDKMVRTDKEETFEFAKNFVAGKYTQEQLEEMFFM